MEEWYSLRQIRFSKRQMRWLILNLGELREGRWPKNPYSADSGYTEAGVGRKNKRYKEPAQNRVLEMAAEVECRLELIMDYISGWERPRRKIKRRRR